MIIKQHRKTTQFKISLLTFCSYKITKHICTSIKPKKKTSLPRSCTFWNEQREHLLQCPTTESSARVTQEHVHHRSSEPSWRETVHRSIDFCATNVLPDNEACENSTIRPALTKTDTSVTYTTHHQNSELILI